MLYFSGYFILLIAYSLRAGQLHRFLFPNHLDEKHSSIPGDSVCQMRLDARHISDADFFSGGVFLSHPLKIYCSKHVLTIICM